jgi:arsenate reductase
VELDQDTRYKVGTMVDELVREYGERFARPQIEQLVEDSVERLRAASVVNEFLPILAYRFARERLVALERTGARPEGAQLDVVFVSLSGGGRGQLEA